MSIATTPSPLSVNVICGWSQCDTCCTYNVDLISVTQLHREFLRAGSDVLQSFTFFASDDQLKARGVQTTGAEINEAGMRLVRDRS